MKDIHTERFATFVILWCWCSDLKLHKPKNVDARHDGIITDERQIWRQFFTHNEEKYAKKNGRRIKNKAKSRLFSPMHLWLFDFLPLRLLEPNADFIIHSCEFTALRWRFHWLHAEYLDLYICISSVAMAMSRFLRELCLPRDFHKYACTPTSVSRRVFVSFCVCAAIVLQLISLCRYCLMRMRKKFFHHWMRLSRFVCTL